MPRIEDTYKVISTMKGDYLNRWNSLRGKYMPILNYGAFSSSIAFTPHDYDRHCVGIYRNLELLIPKSCFYEDFFTQEELFVLNTAVLFHDIVMVYNLDDKNKNGFSREAHSKDFRGFIENEIYYKNNTLLASAIKDNEIEPIIDVVLGHSNIKNVTPEINTLELVQEYHIGTGANLKIRTGILAALLRLADEIDINSRRIDGLEYKEGQIGENSIKSLPHWRKCEIFDIPMLSPDNSSILLRPISKKILPKEYFTPRINELGDVISEYNVSEAMLANEELKNDIKFIIELCDKVNAEIEAIKKTIDLHKYIADYKIESARIDNNDIAIAMIEYKKGFSEIDSHTSPVSKKKSIVENLEYANILREIIKSKRLYYHGHCATHSGYRVRDWVDTNLLINDKNDLQEITSNFAKLSVCKKDCIYAGIGFKGLVLASSIAFKTHNKFSYLTPSYDEEFSGSHEQQFTDSGLEIIIVTDIIITGKIVHETILKYKLKNVSAIFCILHRKPSNDELCDDNFWSTYENSIYALNNDVEVELCKKKEDCLLGDCQNNKV